MNWSVDVSFVEQWPRSLDARSYQQIMAALELLQQHGPQLGRPLVDSVVGSRYKNMKELRPGSSGRSEVRALFAFDPKRRAILLIAGDKSGRWNDRYASNIPVADQRYAEHLRRLKENHDDA